MKFSNTVFAGTLATAAMIMWSTAASAAGICLSVGGPLYGGGILASDSAFAGCQPGIQDNTAGGGGIVTYTPNPLPVPITNMTSATLNFTDPTGNADSAKASLPLGTLGASSAGSLTGGSNGGAAALDDVVHFHVSDTANPVPITFSIHVGGTETGGGLFNIFYQLNFVGVLSYQMDNFGGHPGNFNVASDPGWGTFTNKTSGGFDYSGSFNVTDGEAIALAESLTAACVGGETCDFSHTASIFFTLPADVTFTSDSGVLLTGGATGRVPEPITLSLFGAGLAGAAALRRRKKKSA